MVLLMPMIPTPIDAEAGAATDEGRRPTVAAPASASPELTVRLHRRIFTAQDKLRTLADTDRAADTGGIAGELWKVINQTLVDRGIECGYPIHGHSYGLGWESPWLIPGAEAEIEPGMAIAIECMAGREPVGFVKFEHNLLVHQDKIELLSTCPERA